MQSINFHNFLVKGSTLVNFPNVPKKCKIPILSLKGLNQVFNSYEYRKVNRNYIRNE